MLKMASQLETIINTYKTLSKIPMVAGGRLNKLGKAVSVNWSIRNFDKGKNTKYNTSYILDDGLNVISQSEFATDISNELLSAVSPKETYRAIIREEKNNKDVKKQYLEVWRQSTLAHCIDLTALDLHGDVYADSEFGNLDWSPDETKIVYVAERKQPKYEPYIKRKVEKEQKSKCEECKSGAGDDGPKKGEEFLYRQDWGEQLVGKYSSVIVVCALADESLTVLDYLPAGCCPGQVRFSPDGSSVVGVSWPTEPRRLGLIFCTNRPSFIFSLTLDGVMSKLSSEGKAVRSPRFSPAGHLVWLQRAADGPHHACQQIVIKKTGSDQSDVLVDIVGTQKQTTNGFDFHGAYNQALPKNCFPSDSRLVFSTPQKNEIRSYVVDLETGDLTDISMKSPPGSTTVLDVQNDIILSTYTNLTTPGQVYVAKLPPKGSEDNIKWLRVSETTDPLPISFSHVEYLQLTHEGVADDVNSFSAIYFAPKADQIKKLPLIVWPHGGPHSNFVNAYSLEAAFFNMLGFAVIQINYRGSSGAGDASLRYLPGKAGDKDVKDCKLATDVALNKFPINNRQVMLAGGSHGGFLVTHLSGQYPDVYRAVVSRNPVVDVATMINYTDINDWGAGDASARCLIGHVGEYDVDDCRLALTTLTEREGTNQVVLYGGSYGGLVIAHLAAKQPELFKAAVMRNPLIDLAIKGQYADNSDGCAVEAGFDWTERGPVIEEQLVAMRRCSPLAHVHRVKAPTAMMLGSGDKRVPYYQGLEFVRRLKANGVETRVYMYEDNHSLSSQPAEMDNLINGAHWFISHLD